MGEKRFDNSLKQLKRCVRCHAILAIHERGAHNRIPLRALSDAMWAKERNSPKLSIDVIRLSADAVRRLGQSQRSRGNSSWRKTKKRKLEFWTTAALFLPVATIVYVCSAITLSLIFGRETCRKHFLFCLIIYWSHLSQLSMSNRIRFDFVNKAKMQKRLIRHSEIPLRWKCWPREKIASSSEYFWNVGQPKMCVFPSMELGTKRHTDISRTSATYERKVKVCILQRLTFYSMPPLCDDSVSERNHICRKWDIPNVIKY